jgi:dUTPase
MADVEHSGYYIYGCDYADVEDCHSDICGNLNYTTVPHSKNESEGAIPREFMPKTRVGRLRVETLSTEASKPTKSEAQRTGLTLTSVESKEIQPGQTVHLSTRLILRSFKGRQAGIPNSFQGPRQERDKVHVRSKYLTAKDYGKDIIVALVNSGCAPHMVNVGDCIAQIFLLGVDDVECEVSTSLMQESTLLRSLTLW